MLLPCQCITERRCTNQMESCALFVFSAFGDERQMSKGAFLKENRNKQEGATPQQNENNVQRNAVRRRNRRKKQQQKVLIIIVLVFLVILLIGLLLCLRISPLVGTWYMDEVTAYRFEKNGKGALVLPSAEYEFTYKVDEEMLYIDFAHEGAKNAQYFFSVSGNTLTLNGGNATTKGEYVLSRLEK